MSRKTHDEIVHALQEQSVRYVTGAKGQPVAVLLTLEEYDHYLDLLDDEADSQDPRLAARLAQAAAQPTDEERQSFREYLRQRRSSRSDVQS
jgi:PHD/YefM family antitoxin component YafN of YafNO toxin-antitoxin module